MELAKSHADPSAGAFQCLRGTGRHVRLAASKTELARNRARHTPISVRIAEMPLGAISKPIVEPAFRTIP